MGVNKWIGTLVHGVGLNDSETAVSTEKGLIKLKSYTVWCNMMRRCYKPQKHEKANYVGCSVSEDWLRYSNFKQFYDDNYFEGSQLDKDIIEQHNRIYSPDTCIFVSPKVNVFFTTKRGSNMTGVSLTSKGRYQVQIKTNYKAKSLGVFDTRAEAYKQWRIAKHEKAVELASTQTNKHIINALLTRWKVLG